MAISEVLYETGILFLTFLMYIVFLVGIPYIIAYALKTILKLTKHNKKSDKIFWVVFITLLALWNALIFYLEIFW